MKFTGCVAIVKKEHNMSRRLKVYLDTSVISHLSQEDVPEKMEDTRKLWEMFRKGIYDVCLSTVTLQEIDDCSEPKRSCMLEFLNQIEYETYDITDEVFDVARQLVSMGVLTQKSFDDCQHIGVAVVNACDCIISWNFKHIVNVKTIRGVRAITNLEGYKPIEIWSPSVLLESEE
jgi:predicted nucleic acid-binding protein